MNLFVAKDIDGDSVKMKNWQLRRVAKSTRRALLPFQRDVIAPRSALNQEHHAGFPAEFHQDVAEIGHVFRRMFFNLANDVARLDADLRGGAFRADAGNHNALPRRQIILT